jgi:hypothetical protein
LKKPLRLYGHIQRRGRLVGDEDFRIADQGHGDHHALPHAAAHFEGILIDAFLRSGDPHLSEHLDGLGAGLGLGQGLVQQDRLCGVCQRTLRTQIQ